MFRVTSRTFKAPAVALLAALLPLAAALRPGPLLAARRTQASPGARRQPAPDPGDAATITFDEIDYDEGAGVAHLKGNVEVLSGNRILRADEMTVKRRPGEQSQMDWAKARGHVYLEEKAQTASAPPVLTGTGERGEYHDQEQTATLEDNVVLHYGSMSLAEPATITGARADIDMKVDRAVVHRSPERQVRTLVKPKGRPPATGEPETPPEPIELTSDEVTRDGKARTFVATGDPLLVRGSSRMKADKIWCQLEQETDVLKDAHGDGNVVIDNEDEKNGQLHATGDHVTYVQATSVITLTGHVHATQKLKNQPEARTASFAEFSYNSNTRAWSGKGGAGGRGTLIFPQGTTPAPGSGPRAQPATGGSRSK